MKTRLWLVFAALFIAVFGFASCSESLSDSASAGTPDSIVVTDDDSLPKDEAGTFLTAGGNSSGQKGEQNGDDTATPGAGEDSGDGSDDPAREIAEADIYKVEGSILWVLNSYRGLVAIDISDPKNMKILGRAAFKGYPKEMYIQEGRAYILVTDLFNNLAPVGDEGFSRDNYYSELVVVDIADPVKSSVIAKYETEGTIVDSRQVGDVIYVVSTEREYYWYYCNSEEMKGKNQLTIMSLNISDPLNITLKDKKSVDGVGQAIYVNDHALYVAQNDEYYYDEKVERKVYYFDISDPAGAIIPRGQVATQGVISDRWKMFEKSGVFFAVTSSNNWGNGENKVESFNVENPDNITAISDFTFMTQQALYGARFDGNRLYAITFFQQDPLHVIDITNASNMFELGQLAVPGWSTHIEIRGTKLLTVGVDNVDGWTAKVSMYDVADPANPKEMNTIELTGDGGYSWSEAANDWKAFKIYDEAGLILLPTSEYSYTDYKAVNKLHLIDFDLEKGLTKRGSIECPGYVKRGVLIDNIIASISDTTVLTIDFADRDNPKILGESTVAERVDSIMKCGNIPCGFTSTYVWDNQPIKIAAYTANDKFNPITWKSETLKGDYVTSTAKTDSGLIALLRSYYYDKESSQPEEKQLRTAYYFKFGETNPELVATAKLELPPATVAGTSGQSYYYYSENIALTPKALVMFFGGEHYIYPEEGDGIKTEPTYETHSVFAVYSLSEMSQEIVKPVIVDKQFKPLSPYTPIISNSSKIYISDCEVAGYDADKREMLACYAQAIETTNPKSPELAERINIPGELVGMSDDGTILYSKSREWSTENTDNQGSYYYNSYEYKLTILKRANNSSDKVSVVAVIPFKDSYSYTDSTSNYTQTTISVQDKSIFVAYLNMVYNYQESECGYYNYNSSTNIAHVKVLNSEGDIVAETNVEDGYYATPVDGGGLMVAKRENGNIFYGSTTSDNLTYIEKNGLIHDIKLPETSSMSMYWYWGYTNAARIGDSLYIPRGWDGLEAVSLK